MKKNQKIIVIGVAIILALFLGAAWARNTAKEKPKVSFAESNLGSLEDKLESLNIEDLEGLSGIGSLNVSSQNIDQLGLDIENLEFDDLEGISTQ